MICPNCGFENEKDSRFCGNCGARLPEKKSKTPLTIALVIVFVILAAAVIGYFAYDFLSDDKEEVRQEEQQPDTGEAEEEAAGEIEGEVQDEESREEGWEITNVAAPASTGSARELSVAQAMATSVIDQQGYDNSADMVLDGKDETSWQEGVSGDGIGEGISLYFDQEYEVKYIALKLGNWRSDDYYAQNNRPETLKITMGGQSAELSFADLKQEQWIAVDGDCNTSEIKFEIVSVYHGSNPDWDDTCIAEISVYGEEEM